jgi:peroxiredoxin
MRILAGFVWVWIAVFASAAAEVPKPPIGAEVKARVDKKADDILRDVAAEFAGLKSVEAGLRIVTSIQGPGIPKQELPAVYSLAVERPNRFALILKEGLTGATMVSDGTNVTSYVPMLSRYQTTAAPKDLSGLKDGASGSFGGMMFVGALFDEHPYEALIAGVSEVKYAGEEEGLQRLNFKQEEMNWSLFIQKGDKPVLRRIEIDVSETASGADLPAGLEQLVKQFKMAMTMEFTDWKLNSAIPKERFQFTPPEGAKPSDDLLGNILGAKEEAREGEDSSLIGEEAPKFKAPLLAGGEFDSATLKNAPAAVVFWSGEAEHTTKVLETVHAWAAASGLKAVFINTAEPREKAGELVKKRSWKGTFASDPDGKVAEDFEVEGVPMTFLIDKDGVIKRAYLGFHDDLKDLLAKDAQALGAAK